MKEDEIIIPCVTNEMIIKISKGEFVQILPPPGKDYFYEIKNNGEILKRKIDKIKD